MFNKKIGLLTSFFYSLSVLPIQLSHFYAVDTPLTFFIILTLYLLIRFYEKSTTKNIILVGIFFGLALATKVSAVILIIPIILTFILKLKTENKLFIVHCSLFIVATITTFVVTMPFAVLDFANFWSQTLQQQQMTKSAFTFPYTLQYVGKIPYLYELKNIFFWGLGPILATLAFFGTIFLSLQIILNLIFHKSLIINHKSLILLIFFWIYFFITGSFAIGFMRYMLPLYPLFCLFAAMALFHIVLFLKHKFSKITNYTLYAFFSTLLLIWPLSFIHIYSQPTTRILASDWILDNIPRGSKIALEHWDDGLPLQDQSDYQILELPMYDPDSPAKWLKINQVLTKTDYIVIASNRLYVPLQKLTNCEKLPSDKCYIQTAQYYQKLFNGSLGFSKVAEFSIYPTIPYFNIPISDFSADESFTVYDHPKIMIFKKNFYAKTL